MHQKKACAKSELTADAQGFVKGYASTFDRDPDSYGDVIAKGAFAKSLERWKALNEEGRYIPLLWGHDTSDPSSNIGRVVEAREDDRGLYIEAEFDADNEKAQYVRKLVQEGRVYQFSFAFDCTDWGEVTLEDGRKANELREIEIYEVSLVQIPANQHATVEEIKAPEQVVGKAVVEIIPVIKAGRRNSAKDAAELERIASLCDEIKEAVNGLMSDDAETPDAVDEGEEQSEGPSPKGEVVEAYKQAIYSLIGD